MSRLMKIAKLGLLAAVAVSGVALSTTPASAAIACNRYGECWHTTARYTNYPSSLGIRFYEDSWRATHMRRYHWRADPRDDHGYYSRGHWRSF